MTTEYKCPFCGAPIDNPNATECPSCGNALSIRPGSAPVEVTQKPEFNSSAEVMDEVKDLIREGDTAGAAGVAGAAFGLDSEAAKDTVEQMQIDMQHSGQETPPSAAAEPGYTSPAPQVIDAPGYDAPKKSSSVGKWIIGGVIGATILLCVCCVLTILIFVPVFRNGQ